MFNYVLLVVVVLGVYTQNLCRKQFEVKLKDKDFDFSFQYILVFLVSAFVFLGIIYVFKFNFCLETISYSFIFSITFSVTIIASFYAIKNGPLSLTVLISSLSLLLPMIYGLFFLGESISIIGIIGLILLFVSLFLINKLEKGIKINKKWLIAVIIYFFANGGNYIIQKEHQLNVEGDYTICFQFFAMLFAIIIIGSAILITKRKGFRKLFRNKGYFPCISGVANAIANVSMLYLASNLKAFILYPVVSAGGIILTFITAITLFRERLNKWQYIGYFCGVCSVVLLNL